MNQTAVDELCVRLAQDLDSAFAELVLAHQQLVFGVALRVVGDPAAAEDVAQDSFVRAYRSLKRYPAERVVALRPRPWLARIALNTARSHLRRNRPTTALDHVAEPEARSGDGPVRHAERRDERQMWARLLAGLPDRYRLPVALRFIDEMSYAEAAETLGKPIGTVKSDVHRGVELLRAAYDAEQRLISEKEAV